MTTYDFIQESIWHRHINKFIYMSMVLHLVKRIFKSKNNTFYIIASKNNYKVILIIIKKTLKNNSAIIIKTSTL